ncbi:hypothetical protein [Methanosarcina acetivorans]|uniref:Uncharacterized protein n=1 Tax=Methanosarcina acetivorans (strain ATCC 35395 / DSM 2834 / JCM 12185 / C2A) TaxID=188937 RepID=Q8TJE2_METAC|nr:hypothetical protein [Methanosarcina acetivorans]AAM07194.1 predicted protein [Methanosarcina acetivorans C2A]
MYIKSKCPVCGSNNFHNVQVRIEETRKNLSLKDVNVTDTVTDEELAREVLHGLKPHVCDGITIRELCRVIKKYYGVAAAYCCDLVSRLKIEMGMYCPDRRHLYFVSPFPPQ